MSFFELRQQEWQVSNRYLSGNTPWESGIVPPKLVDFLTRRPVGRAVDMGCGTGLNTVYMAELGWEAVGLDFAGPAIRRARRRANTARREAQLAGRALDVAFYQADVTGALKLRPPYQFVFDQGCLNGIPRSARARHINNVRWLLAPGHYFLLYAHAPRSGRSPRFGATEAEVRALTAYGFVIESVDHGEDIHGGDSAWYVIRRTL